MPNRSTATGWDRAWIGGPQSRDVNTAFTFNHLHDVEPAVDLSTSGLLLATRFLALHCASEEGLRPLVGDFRKAVFDPTRV